MKPIIKGISVVAIAFFALAPLAISAAELRMESTVTVSDEYTISDNLYIGAGRALILGTSNLDTAVVAGESILAGTFGEDVLSISGETISEGVFGGDLRIVSPDVSVAGTVDGDLFVIGGNIVIEERAVLKGDIVVIGGSLKIYGEVQGKAKIIAGVVDIAGKLGDRTTITTQKLTLESGAQILGDVFYFAPNKAVQAPNVILQKPLKYNPISKISDSQIIERAILSFMDFWIVLKFITTLVVTFILVYVFKVFSQYAATQTKRDFLKMFVLGVLSTIGIPLVSAVFMISLFALPLGIILIFALMIMILITPALSGIIAGIIATKVVRPKSNPEVNFKNATIGVILLAVLQFIPYLGDIVALILFFASVGITVYYLYQTIRGKKTR